MERAKIEQAVNSIFINRFEFEAEELTADKRIFEDLELDSLDVVDMILA